MPPKGRHRREQASREDRAGGESGGGRGRHSARGVLRVVPRRRRAHLLREVPAGVSRGVRVAAAGQDAGERVAVRALRGREAAGRRQEDTHVALAGAGGRGQGAGRQGQGQGRRAREGWPFSFFFFFCWHLIIIMIVKFRAILLVCLSVCLSLIIT